MTAQIFLNLLHHGFIKLSQVNLLIFDECHHAKKSHPYKQIMNRFVGCQEADYPKIMGLTASVVNKKVKPGKIESEIQELECTLRSTCETSQDEDVGKFASKPNEQIIQFSNANFDNSTVILLQKLQEVLRPGMNYLRDYEVQGDGPSWDAQSFALSALTECQEILSEMGPWAANKVAGYLIKDLQGKVTDPDLQIRRRGGSSHPAPEIWGRGPVSRKGGGAGPSPGSATESMVEIAGLSSSSQWSPRFFLLLFFVLIQTILWVPPIFSFFECSLEVHDEKHT